MARLIRAPGSLAMLPPALLIVGGFVAWQRYGAQRVRAAAGVLEASAIHAAEPPPGVPRDVVERVVRRYALHERSASEPGTPATLARCLSRSAWIDAVRGVRPRPGGGFDVDMTYRTPAAMVRVYKPGDDAPYYFPVDADGVLLPPTDFDRRQTADFIHIDASGAFTRRPVGEPFGDARVEAAASLAGMLHEYRDVLGVREITVDDGSIRSGDRDGAYLVVRRAGNVDIEWDSPPGYERPGELTANEKLRRLLDVATNRRAER